MEERVLVKKKDAAEIIAELKVDLIKLRSEYGEVKEKVEEQEVTIGAINRTNAVLEQENLDLKEIIAQPSKLREELREFADAQESVLRVHDEDRGDSWRDASVAWLFHRLEGEVGELQDAFNDCLPERVRMECLDVANFAMFIFSKLKGEVLTKF